jgi:hypothetical protein
MTRNSDLRLDDLFGCDHTPETPIVDESIGEILWWVCRCGRHHPTVKNTQSTEAEACPKA